ncbi:MAG: hypothetical protein ACMUIL_01245 [bacterium]
MSCKVSKASGDENLVGWTDVSVYPVKDIGWIIKCFKIIEDEQARSSRAIRKAALKVDLGLKIRAVYFRWLKELNCCLCDILFADDPGTNRLWAKL